ncbi:9327_t:CDS:2, partial [Gigaspora margarita]
MHSHLFGPGFVCSNNVQAGTARDCIYACHVPGDCQSGTCAKTSPHWLCICKTDSDCLV